MTISAKFGRLLLPAYVVAMLCAGGCSRSPQAKEARYLASGKRLLDKKDFARATLEFQNAIKAMPSDAEPYFQLGLAYLGSNDLSSAVACFRKAQELNPKHIRAQAKLAELFSMSGNKEQLQEARKRAAELLVLSPGDVDLLNTLALSEMRLGDPQTAEEHLQEALAKVPTDLKSSVNLARARLLRKDVAGAETVLREAITKAPKSPEAAMALGEFFIVTGKLEEAERQFRALLAFQPAHGPALVRLGQLLVRTNRNDEAEQIFRRASALPEKQYRALHAGFLFQTGKRDAAIKELEQLAQHQSSDRDLRTQLVLAYLIAGRNDDAEKLLASALKKNEKDVDALLQRARIYLAGRKYPQAQGDIEQILRFRSDSAEAHYLKAQLHAARKESGTVRSELEEALKIDSRFLAARLQLAQLLMQTNAAKAALTLLEQTPQEQKNNSAVILLRNWGMIERGEIQIARATLDKVLEVARIPEALLQDSFLKFQAKNYKAALGSVEEVLKQTPEELRALELLLRIYSAQHALPEGLEKLRAHAATRPQSATLQLFTGRVLALAGRRDQARAALEAAKAAGQGTAASMELAGLDIGEGKVDHARQTLTAMLPQDGSDGGVRLRLAALETASGNSKVAIDHYRKVLELDPRNTIALNNLAYLLTDAANNADEALRYAQQAKELAPNDAGVDDTLGWTYYRKGIYSMAITHLEAAIQREATPRRRYHLAMAYLKNGDEHKGRTLLEAALKADPSLPEAAAAKQLLAGVGRK